MANILKIVFSTYRIQFVVIKKHQNNDFTIRRDDVLLNKREFLFLEPDQNENEEAIVKYEKIGTGLDGLDEHPRIRLNQTVS